MARAPDKRIEQAKEMYLQGQKLVEIASQLNLPEGTVRRWKCTHKWDNERSDKKNERSRKRKRGAQPKNQNAVGNNGGAPEQNKNAEKFGLNNIEIIHGNAAAVIDSLPVPDKVFIGGSGGELEYIFSSILKKNPYVHIVVTAVTLETLNNTISLMEKNGMNVLDIVQIAVTEVKKRGRYHMMSANNPVFIIEGRGAK